MPSQDADQLGSCVATGADHRNADSFGRRALPATRPDRLGRRFETCAHRRLPPLAEGRLESLEPSGWIAAMTCMTIHSNA
jgi:hypothetical protein